LLAETSSLDATIIPELQLDHPNIKRIYHNAFHSLKDFSSEEEFSKEIFRITECIEEKIYSLKD